MRRNRAITIVATAALLSFLSAGKADASGFVIYDLSADALAQSSAVSASIENPMATWYNPAGLAFMPGWQVSLGGSYIRASNAFDPASGGATVTANPGNFTLPTLAVGGRILDWFAVGLGIYTPYGLGTSWPKDWIGREYAIDTSIQTLIINPTLAFQLYKTVSLGVGADIAYSAVDMVTGLPAAMGGTGHIGGTTWSAGGNIGLLWKAIPGMFHVAATYRSRIALNFDGKADFDPDHPEFDRTLPDQNGKASITVPDIITLGLTYRPMASLTLGLDVNVLLWSVYDKLVLDLEESADIVHERKWKNGVTLRLGTDWIAPIKPETGKLHVRGGFSFDLDPARKEYLDPSLPESNRLGLSIGLGYEYRWIQADLGYMFIYFLPAEATTGQESPEGTYHSYAHMLGLTLTGRFGPAAK